MHGLETIAAINNRARRKCEECKKNHCEVPGAEVHVSTYAVSGFVSFVEGTTIRRDLCVGCAAGHTRRGFTIVKEKVTHGAS